jgi:hypothetical protein
MACAPDTEERIEGVQVSPITDPKKKWAVVFCALEGSSPDSSVVRKQLGRGGDVGVIRSS